MDGGYTQSDVIEVARVLTGWSLESRRSPVFAFRSFAHEGGHKTVMGWRVPGRGEEEGVALLRHLARHPATARHVSRKLAARFVSDAPPPDNSDRRRRMSSKVTNRSSAWPSNRDSNS